VIERIRERGMKPGLWVSVGSADTAVVLARLVFASLLLPAARAFGLTGLGMAGCIFAAGRLRAAASRLPGAGVRALFGGAALRFLTASGVLLGHVLLLVFASR
jgi:hypothetical protein